MNITVRLSAVSRLWSARAYFARSLLLLGLGLAGVAVPAQAQKIATIAHYTFSDSSNLFTDSSGNSHNLTWAGSSTGVIQSADHNAAAATDVSVYFPASHGVAYKAIPLSGYTALTFDWSMKTTDTRATDGVVFQLGSSATSAGFLSIRLLANTEGAATTLRISHRVSSTVSVITEFSISDPSLWASYSLTVDNSITGAAYVSLMINDVAQQASSAGTKTVAGTFLDELRIGAATSTTNPFTGYLQNFELYAGTAIPEPSAAVLFAGLAGAAVAFGARRRR